MNVLWGDFQINRVQKFFPIARKPENRKQILTVIIGFPDNLSDYRAFGLSGPAAKASNYMCRNMQDVTVLRLHYIILQVLVLFSSSAVRAHV